MTSLALASFDADIDASTLSAAERTQVKARALQLYQEGVREVAAHIKLHFDAELAAAVDPDDIRVLGFMSDVLVSFATRIDFQEAQIAALFTPQSNAEAKWGAALGAVMGAGTVERAGRIFDALLARYDSPAVRTRLLALRDLITTKLGT